jgi:signal transduction histidine kinase
VDALGAGDLSSRVEVEGNDEVANLASSFNQAAERIEKLVNAQRTLLASASHELRSPLTRIQMGLELLADDNRPELRVTLSKDIAELDELIGELLLASRLEALDQLEHP